MFIDLACKLRAKPLLTVPDSFIAYVHASFMQKVFHIPQCKWEPHVQHNCKLDDCGAGFGIAEGYRIGHGIDAHIHQAVGQGGLF